MASDRTVYRVQPEAHEWKLTKYRERIRRFPTQAAAVEDGRQAARASQPSQLVVHDHPDKIETESTYQDNPFPPRG
ncbi:DUF2188 domain-containing protein [Actinopolymorpha pittospori]|uniref:DUF2188 domain-containing protein n=1 Tax=Actinopolymorpha pittospori TaxID=648752 RepID=A0A927MQN5_9ACTN|nr:DUF2188 domain-containing protein [Actinopolymorpha pittospori]MBE1603458.1 hypothetical protein [Actinopolymorpha pittospori]